MVSDVSLSLCTLTQSYFELSCIWISEVIFADVSCLFFFILLTIMRPKLLLVFLGLPVRPTEQLFSFTIHSQLHFDSIPNCGGWTFFC